MMANLQRITNRILTLIPAMILLWTLTPGVLSSQVTTFTAEELTSGEIPNAVSFASMDSSVHNISQDTYFDNIQEAIDSAGVGDTIEVAAGTYEENISFDKSIILHGPNHSISPNTGIRVSEAIIASPGGNSIIDNGGGNIIEIKGFSVIPQDTVDVRFVYGNDGNTWILEKNIFSTIADSLPGAVQSSGGQIFFQNNPVDLTFHDNYATNYSSNGLVIFSSGNVSITNNVFEDYLWYAMNLNNVVGNISGNIMRNGGYGMTLASSGNDIIVENNLFEGIFDLAVSGSGAFGYSIVFWSNFGGVCTIQNNSFVDHERAAIYAWAAPDLSETVVSNNSFLSDTFALWNTTSNDEAILATCNWYGTDDIDSVGTKISGQVFYLPILTDGTDNEPGEVGFTPLPDVCDGYGPVVNTSQNVAFFGIQSAIDQASEGDTIQVGTATFFESILIDKKGLVLINGSYPVMDGGDTTTVVHITADSVTVKGFEIRNAAPDSALIFIDNAVGVTIDSNKLTNPNAPALYGVAIQGGGEHTITQNNIDSVAYGIAVDTSVDNNIGVTGLGNSINTVEYGSPVIPTGVVLQAAGGNSIQGNLIESPGYGIHIADESSNNTIENNAVAGQDHGIILRVFNNMPPADYSGINNTIHQNDITATDSTDKYGIKIEDDADTTTITSNSIHSGWGGIWIENSDEVSVENNFVNTSEYGIRLQSDVGVVTVNNNELSGPSVNSLENSSTNVVDASCNWWGSDSLDVVVGLLDTTNVNFIPFLFSDEDDDSDASNGFQPTAGACMFDLVCPSDTTVVESGMCMAFVNLDEAVSNDPQADITNDYNAGGADASDTFDFGVTIIEFEAVSATDDTLNCSVTVTVEEEVTLSCPATDTIYLDNMCMDTLPDYTTMSSVIDGCDTLYNFSQSISAGTPLTAAGFLTVEVVAVNSIFGNSDTCQIEVAVLDSIPPTISCNLVLGFTVSLNDSCEATIPTFDAIAFYTPTPNCDTMITFSQNPVQGTVISGEDMTLVTLSLSDQSGNSSSCSFDFNTVDLTPPVVTCPAPTDTISVDGSCQAMVPDYEMQTSVTDNCDMPSVVQNIPPASLLGPGDTTVVVHIEDDGGNQDSCTIQLTIVDDTPPVASCNGVIINLDQNCEANIPDFEITGDASATDNCDTTLTYTQFPSAGGTFVDVGVDTVLAVFTDQSGNSDSCEIEVTLIDVTAPNIECLDTLITVEVDSMCNYTVEDFSYNVSVSDNCDSSPLLSQIPDTNATFLSVGTQTITLTATDSSFNSSSCSFEIEIVDNLAPVVSCPPSNDTIFVDGNCEASVPDYVALTSATDNCDTPVITQDTSSGSPLDIGSHVIVISAEDNSGNVATCVVFLEVQDTISPLVLDCPTDTLVLDMSCEVSLPDYFEEVNISDNCDTLFTEVQTPSPGTNLDSAGTYNVLLEATDQQGNTGSCTAVVEVQDNTPPVISSCPGAVTVNLDSACQAQVGDYRGSAIVNDNCDSTISLIQDPSPLTFLNGVGNTTVTITAEDNSGNSSSCSFTLTTDDTIPPTADCPSPVDTIYVDGDCLAGVPDYLTGLNEDDNCGIEEVTQTPSAGSPAEVGVDTILIEVEDESGNTITCEVELHVLDTLAPEVLCANDTIVLDAMCEAVLSDYLADAMVTDNCDTAFTAVQNPVAGTAITAAGSQMVTISFEDQSGNVDSCTFEVVAVDEVAPVLSCPGSIDIYVDPVDCDAELMDYTGTATIDDNCDTTHTVVQSPPPGSIFLTVGTQVVTLTAEDASGNTGSCSFNVNAVDTIPPTADCPSPVDTIYVDGDCLAGVPDYLTGLNEDDNCGIEEVTQTPSAGSPAEVGVDTILIEVEDESGNTITCEVELHVLDTLAPEVICANDTILLDSNCEAVLSDYLADALVTDNCDTAFTAVQTPSAGTAISAAGSQMVTISFEDQSGNVGNCTFEVTAVDEVAPVLSCPGSIDIYVDPVDCNAELMDYTGTATIDDNCDTTHTVVQSPPPGSIFLTVGTQVVTLTAEDASGNTGSCSFNVNAVDTVAPVVNCAVTNDTLFVDGTCQIVVPDYTISAASDNCGSESVTQSIAAGESLSIGSYEVVVTATDMSENQDSCTIELEVIDDTPPVVSCVTDTLYLSADCNVELGDYSDVIGIEDNCDTLFNVTQTPGVGTVIDSVGVLNVLMEVEDQSGNISTCEVEVHLIDTIGPELECMGTLTIYLDEDCESELQDLMSLVTVTPNCDTNLTLLQSPPAGTTYFAPISTVVTLTAEDAYGNMASCQVGLEVQDTLPPSLTCPVTSDTLFVDNNCTAILADYTADVVADDNCDPVTLEQDIEVGEELSPGNYTLEISATDDSENETSCTLELTVLDTIAPNIVECPTDEIVLNSGDCTAELGDYTGEIVFSDNCDTNLTVTQYPLPGTPLTAPGMLNVQMEVEDESGNIGQCVVEVQVLDEVAPEIICPISITMPIFGDCESFIPLLTHTPFIMDNCDTAFTTTQTPPGFTSISGGDPAVVTITVSDMSGNSTSCEVDVLFEDNDPPTVVCPPSNDTLQVDGDCVALIPDYTTGLDETDNCGIESVTQTPGSGETTGPGETTVTITVTDVNGNSTVCLVELVVEDNEEPTIDACEDITLYVDDDCEVALPSLEGQASLVADNCTDTDDLDFSQTPSIGTVLNAPDTIGATLEFTDESGNSAQCSIQVFVLDNIDPTVTCTSGLVIYLNEDEEAILHNLESLVSAEDNCDNDPEVDQSPAIGTVFTEAGFEDILITATDQSGNFATCELTVQVVDTLCPGLTCGDALVEIVVGPDCIAAVPDFTSDVSVSEDCGPITVTQNIDAGEDVGPGTYDITVTATDESDNTAECEVELSVVDNTPPMVSCSIATDIRYLDEDCGLLLGDYTAFADASDNCGTGGLTITQTPLASTDYSGPNEVEVVITATDEGGNSAECSIDVSIEDNTSPELTCPETMTTTVDSDCNGTIPDLLGEVTFSDNCDPSPSTTQVPAANSSFSGTDNVGITFTVMDDSGNAASCSVTLLVSDEIAPEIANCPPDYTFVISSDSCVGVVDVDPLEATDNCTDVDIVNNYNAGGANASGEYPLGTTEVQFTVSDQNGNVSTCLLTIEVNDNTPPVVTHCPADVTVNCGQPTDPYFTGGLASGENVCNGEVEVTYFDEVEGEYCEEREITRTFVLEDEMGNADSSCVQIVTVESDQGPTMVNCPDDIEVNLEPGECEATVELPEEVDAFNSCYHESWEFSGYQPGAFPAVPSLSFNRNQSDLVRIRGFFFNPFPNPGTMSPYPATHGNYHGIVKSANVDSANTGAFSRLGGHSSFFGGGFEASIDVYIELNDPAVIDNTYGWDVGVGVNDQDGDKLRDYFFHLASNSTGQVRIGASTQTDSTRKTNLGAGNSALVTSSRWLRFIWSFEDNGDGTMLATLRVTRLNGTQIFSETFNDASDLIASVVGGNRNMSFPFLEVDDLSVDNVRLKHLPVSTSCDLAGTQTFEVGVHTVECSATDACGNESTCSYTVTVIGEEDLVLDCPSIVSAAAPDSLCVAFVELEAELEGGCDPVIENSYNVGGLDASDNYPIGVTEVVFTATEGIETISCTTSVEVTGNDPEGITLNCPDNISVANDSGECNAFVSLDDAILTTGCEVEGEVEIENNFNSGGENASGTYDVGVTVVTFTAEDDGSTLASCTTVVTVSDNEAPVTNCSDFNLELDEDGVAEIDQAELDMMFSDNCEVSSVVASSTEFDCEDIPSTSITITAEDASGNSTSCTVTVNISDQIDPEISCPSNITVDADPGECFADVTLVAEVSDNCELSTVENSFNNGGSDASGSYEVGTTGVTFTATDQSGNETICTTQVTVNGDGGSSFTLACPASVDTVADDGECHAFVALEEVEIIPACGFDGTVTISNDYNAGGADASDEYPVGSTTVVFSGTDGGTNTASCTVTIAISDEEAPVANCVDLTVELDSTGNGEIDPSDLLAMFEDNCAIDTVVADTTHFSCNDLNRNELDLTATDIYGNQSTCEIDVEVVVGEADCPAPILEFLSVQGEVGDTICVPMVVEDFDSIPGFQFTVRVMDNTVADIIGVQNIALPGLFSSNVNSAGNFATLSWFNLPPLSEPDGTELLCVEVLITGNEGDTTEIFFSDDPTEREVTQVQGGTPKSVGAIFLAGGIEVLGSLPGSSTISGGVYSYGGQPVSEVQVDVQGWEMPAIQTDEYGYYDLTIPFGETVEVGISKEEDFLSGVTTLDIVRIQQHLLQLQPLASQYHIIAADVNGDDVLSTFDLVILQANLVGNKNEFNGNSSWRFIPSDYEFENADQPFAEDFPEVRTYTSVEADKLNQDWTAIKVGDVNGSVFAEDEAEARSSRLPYSLKVSDVDQLDDGLYRIPIYLSEINGLTGMQFTMPAVFENGHIVDLDLNSSNLIEESQSSYFLDAENAELNWSWYRGQGQSISEEDIAFALIVEINGSIAGFMDELKLSTSGRLNAEAYDINDRFYDLSLERQYNPLSANQLFELYQNKPNPFNGRTVIDYQLPESMDVEFTIYADDGRLIRQIQTRGEAGMNEIQLDVSGWSAGLYYYRLNAGEFQGVKTMILVD